MSKKRRSRKKMKPYQVKLRVIGIMSIIVSLLVMWLPIWSEAASEADWLNHFNIDKDDLANTITINSFKTPDNTAVSYELENPAYTSSKWYNIQLANGGYNAGVFQDATKLQKLDLSKVSTDDVTDMQYYFYNDPVLTELNISTFDTSAVTSMNSMFRNDKALKSLDLSSFDTGAVTDMSAMFDGCENIENLTLPVTFTTGNVTGMGMMFQNCKGLTAVDVSGFDTSKVASMQGMFKGCAALTSVDISGFNLSSASGASALNGTFEGCSALESLTVGPNFNSDNVTNFSFMFSGCTSLVTLDLRYMDCIAATNMSDFLTNCAALNFIDTPLNVPSGMNVALPGEFVEVGSDGTTVYTSLPEERSSSMSLIRKSLTEVTSVTLDETNVTLAPDGTKQLTETVLPVTALPPTKTEWTSSDNTIATVSSTGLVTAVKEGGPVTITCTVTTGTGSGAVSESASCMVNVVPYKTVIEDLRTDTSQHNSRRIEGAAMPTSGDRMVVVESSAGENRTASGTKMSDQVDAAAGTSDASYFTLMKLDEYGMPSTDDFGSSVRIRLAVPGRMQNYPGVARVYAYDSSSSTTEAIPLLTDEEAYGGSRTFWFTVDLSGEPALEYALVMTPPSLEVCDNRTNPVTDSKVFRTSKTAPLADNLYLQIRELNGTTAPNVSTVLKPYAETTPGTYKDYAYKHYYEIYLSSDIDGNNKVADTVFNECEVWLSLPSDVNPDSQYFTILSEKAGGGAADKVSFVKETEGTQYFARFTASHFSEFAILDDETSVYTITTTHTGGTTASTTAINGMDATAATAPAGADAAATVPIASTNTVTVTATPGDGYHFVRWTEGGAQVSTEASYTFTPTANRTLNAVFEANSTPTPGPSPTGPFRLTVDRLPTAGGTTATSPEQNAYNAGETVTVTATANTGYTFMYWADETGARLSSDASYQVTMDRDKRLYAVFAQEGEVAGAGRTMDAVVNVNIPDITIPAPQVTVGEPQVSVNIPAINVYADGASANAGTSGTFYPLAFTRPGNYADMPRTGTASMYRVMLTIILLMSGTVEVLLSIPAKKKRRVRTD